MSPWTTRRLAALLGKARWRLRWSGPRRSSVDARDNWRHLLRRRVAVAAAMGAIWACVILGRLVSLQVVQRDDLMARAERQQKRTVPAFARRGEVVDRHGRIIALSADADSIYAVPSTIADPVETAAKLCAALRDCTSNDRKQLAKRLDRRSPFTFVRRLVDPDQAARVSPLGLAGVGFLKETRRYYPNGELASHVLGYVGVENKGLAGVEAAFDRLIRGKDGAILVQADATGRVFSRTEKPSTPGSSIELTLDTYLQHVAERELRAGVSEHRASGGTAIVLNPKTGEILAMANAPTFDPNEYRDAREVERRNRAVQDLYEPGSTFKVVTASAALEDRLMPVDERFNVRGGRIAIGSRVIHDDHTYDELSFTDVIVKSSNVGAIKIGMKVGTDRLSDFVQRFGFGRPSSPDFPGESPGIVWKRADWTESALASVSMGYQIGVTPLQMVAAVGAVANGGELMEPRIVGAVYRDHRRYVVPPKAVRRVISHETAATLTTIMEGVVERGTATTAQIAGYTIAGKTGTAAKLVDGKYSKTDYNASFVGFAPSRDPAVAIIIVVDSPRAGTYYGGSVSAPIFRRIAESALRHLRVPPSVNPQPAILTATHAPATAGPSLSFAPEPVSLTTTTPSTVVPDLTGFSARQAVRTLAQLGVTPRLMGDGLVIAQSPVPGSSFESGRQWRLVLGRPADGTAHGQALP